MSIFEDREDTADQLADALLPYRDKEVVVLAIPRGGVPLGVIVAKRLHAPLDLLLIKKIGHPLSSELAIGAVGLQERILTNHMDADPEYIERETNRMRQELKEQYRMFRGDRVPTPLEGKTAIIVDDGIATGSTVLAGIKILRKRNAAKIVIAAPVTPPEAAENNKLPRGRAIGVL